MNCWVFGLAINQLSWLHLHYLNVYGKGIPRNEEHSHPFWSMHQDLQDEKMGLKTFEDIRQAWGSWARHYFQEFQSQASAHTPAKLV